MNRKLKTQYALIVGAFVVLSLMTWFSATWFSTPRPPPYIFVIFGAGLLLCIGITILRNRAGHFKD
jgi:hypothetical protein